VPEAGHILIFITNELKWFQFLLIQYFNHLGIFVVNSVPVEIEDFVCDAEIKDRFGSQQQFIQSFQFNLNSLLIAKIVFEQNKQIAVFSFHFIRF